MVDLIAGHVPLGVMSWSASIQQIRAGKVKALAVSSVEAAAGIPERLDLQGARLRRSHRRDLVLAVGPAEAAAGHRREAQPRHRRRPAIARGAEAARQRGGRGPPADAGAVPRLRRRRDQALEPDRQGDEAGDLMMTDDPRVADLRARWALAVRAVSVVLLQQDGRMANCTASASRSRAPLAARIGVALELREYPEPAGRGEGARGRRDRRRDAWPRSGARRAGGFHAAIHEGGFQLCGAARLRRSKNCRRGSDRHAHRDRARSRDGHRAEAEQCASASMPTCRTPPSNCCAQARPTCWPASGPA